MKSWKDFILYLEHHDKSLQPLFLSSLKDGKFLRIEDNEIELGFINSFSLEKVEEKLREDHLKNTLQNFFKKGLKIKVSRLLSDSPGADSESNREVVNQKDKLALLRKEALENSIIRYVLDTFDGEVAEIKTDLKSE